MERPDWISDQAKRGRDSWVYFNNGIEGHAVQDTLTLNPMVSQIMR